MAKGGKREGAGRPQGSKSKYQKAAPSIIVSVRISDLDLIAWMDEQVYSHSELARIALERLKRSPITLP